MLAYKKIVFTGKQQVEIQNDHIDEQAPPAGHYLLKMLYSLVSAGTENACYKGQEAWFAYPRVPGYACVGEVVAKADDVDFVEPGDVVFCRGGHAALQWMDAQSYPIKVSKQADLKYVPFTRMAAISISALRVANIELGDDVAVIGLGLIGNFAAQLAALQGGNVLGLDLSAMRLEAAQENGIPHILNSSAGESVEESIRQVFGGRMPSTVIDATGAPRVIEAGLNYVEKGGQMILLGSPRGVYEGNITNVLQHVHQFRYQVDLIGAHEMVCPRAATPYVKHSCQRNERICLDLIVAGKLKTQNLLTHLLPPEEAGNVYEGLAQGNDAYFGVVYDWT